uniref:Cobalamin biosynthesis protein CbiX n=1 Tax=Klebsiella pneumoniae TaxID=573 RepID=A0A344V599_KLEPN|nr:cobalamin biosynthesis protein CbiX [Klebsiella pneumoniae]
MCIQNFISCKAFIECLNRFLTASIKKAGITRLFSYSCLRGFLRVIYNGIAQSTAYKKHASAPQPYRNASGLLSK